MSEPRTTAGRTAEQTLCHFDTCAGLRGPNPCDCGVVAAILAIEEEAAALDVDRLAEAWAAYQWSNPDEWAELNERSRRMFLARAQEVAGHYRRLSALGVSAARDRVGTEEPGPEMEATR